jgi:uncharacterized Zn finger protein (UPF0148 family)
MSEFDKEAEREKLREKYERDQQKRKETERMSQLLLQGATMTNRHCDTCGDPLFRYQGNQFCATCEGRAQEAEAASRAQPEAQAQEAETGTDVAETSRPADDRRETTPIGDQGDPDPVDADAAMGADAGGDVESAPEQHDTPAPTVEDRAAVEADTPDSSAHTSTSTSRSGGEPPTTETSVRTTRDAHDAHGGEEADLDAARASLIRTLTHHARRAEAVEDPRRATDHLTAVREAADALSALEGRR